MKYQRVRLMMTTVMPAGFAGNQDDVIKQGEITPTGNWKVECRDGVCKLLIGYMGKTLVARDKKIKTRLGFNRKIVENYTIDTERFVSEDLLTVETISEITTCHSANSAK